MGNNYCFQQGKLLMETLYIYNFMNFLTTFYKIYIHEYIQSELIAIDLLSTVIPRSSDYICVYIFKYNHLLHKYLLLMTLLNDIVHSVRFLRSPWWSSTYVIKLPDTNTLRICIETQFPVFTANRMSTDYRQKTFWW